MYNKYSLKTCLLPVIRPNDDLIETPDISTQKEHRKLLLIEKKGKKKPTYLPLFSKACYRDQTLCKGLMLRVSYMCIWIATNVRFM